ncbi:lysozyme inhibitor LprI family protein [Erwinia amylovora]
MRNLNLTVAIIAALTSLNVIAKSSIDIQTELEIREECSFSPVGIKKCVQMRQEKSSELLKKAEVDAENTLSRWDENQKFVRLAKKNLIEANRVFSHYRDAQCNFAASLGGGAVGNALETGRLACQAELNERRAKQLNDFSSALPE